MEVNERRPMTSRNRLHQWQWQRGHMTKVRLISVALACAGITLSGTTLFASTARTAGSARDPAQTRTPAFGVVGVGLMGICAEIEERDSDPRKLISCEPRRLSKKNLDLDYPAIPPRSADILVENGVLRAGDLAYFQVLAIDERPTYAKCAHGRGGRQYWLSFTDLPGLTVCVHSDEGRTAILQTESIDARSKVIQARLTVWDKS
jgi:hypothetical protein